ncbi:cupin [Candidatus Shapirobacteria bacterium]|nr:cupin [Candidatus Shapirobacteria bacterium]
MSRSKFSVSPYSKRIEKPWGYELILAPASLPFTGKILHIKQGARLSLQYHEQKQETLCLLKGKAKLYLEDSSGVLQEFSMEPLKGYLVVPFQKHRMEGITDCDLLEASTAEKGNTVRLEDDYDRSTETEEDRKLR